MKISGGDGTNMNVVKKFWNTCAFKYAHLNDGEGRLLRPGSPLEQIYKFHFMDVIKFEHKSLIDYGCGGGYVPRYLFEHRGLKQAFCIDIAERSLKIAKKILKKKNAKFYLAPVRLDQFKADILLCIACIQHFADKKELDSFLKNANTSNVKVIILQIRSGELSFNNAYNTGGDVGYSCVTNEPYISKALSNYKIYKLGDILSNQYQYIIWVKK